MQQVDVFPNKSFTIRDSLSMPIDLIRDFSNLLFFLKIVYNITGSDFL